MKFARRVLLAGLAAGVAGFTSPVQAAIPPIAITEWMYNGLGTGSIGEFVEFTNMSAGTVDMTGWSFDDSSRAPGSQSLTAFGVLQPGESVIFTDDTATNFRTNWGLPISVKVIGGNINNLGRADEINLYDNTTPTAVLIDRLTYDDQTLGGPRTNGTAGGPASDLTLGANTVTQWSLFTTTGAAGDPHSVGVLTSLAGEKGNPGRYVPEPGSIGLVLAGILISSARRRRA